MTKAKRILTTILLLALVLTIGGELFLAFSVRASAAEAVSHSNVLDDLSKDSKFNPADYPAKADDYSLQVIQIAEGANGELFVYVYQPSNDTKDLKATKINMSLQEPTDKNATYSLYNLTWLNSNGVFDKYVVNDFTVSDAAYRYYTIATIYRTHDKEIDDDALDTDDIVNYEGEAVAKSWCCYIYNNVVITESKTMQVADVEIQSVGYTRYSGGFELSPTFCDSHFVAFSVTNFDVDWVYDADVAYTYCNKHYRVESFSGETITYGDKFLDEITISDTETAEYKGDGWFSYKYTWRRISTVKDFISETEDNTNNYLSEADKENLSNAQFVFRFLETDVVQYNFDYSTTIDSTEVTEVAILRLHFLADGKVYNLGVVSDIISDDGAPDYIVTLGDNIQNGFEDLSVIMQVILFIVIAIAIYCIFNFVKPIIKLIWEGIKFGFSIVFWLLTWPFILLAWIFKHI